MARRPDEGRDGRIRAFYAVELGSGARRAAAACAGALRPRHGDGVRWVAAEALHVTLRFLGAVEPGLVPELGRRVAAELAALEPFRLQLGPPLAFPSPRRPRVVALDLEPHEPLLALAGAVERGVVAAGLPAEERRFRPHLTLGRVKGPLRRLDVTAADTPPAEAWEVTEAVLFRSDLGRRGARYTPLERVPLGGAGGKIPTPFPDSRRKT